MVYYCKRKKKRGITNMLREFAWKTFENTGNINNYMFFREIDENSKAREERKIAEEEAATSK